MNSQKRPFFFSKIRGKSNRRKINVCSEAETNADFNKMNQDDSSKTLLDPVQNHCDVQEIVTRDFSSTEINYPYRWVILGVLWITYVVVFLNRLSVGPLAPFFKEELGITSAKVGFVLSAGAFGYLLTQLPVGWLADKIGSRWPIAIGEIIAGIAMSAQIFSKSYSSLLVLMFVTGLGCGFLAPSTTQAVILWFPKKERATVMGLKQTAVNVGGIIGAATLPSVALVLGWRFGFLMLGIISVMIGILSLILYREPPLSMPSNKNEVASKTAATPLLEILKNREIWFVAMAAFFLNWVEMAMIAHFVLFLTKSLLYSVVMAGGLLALAEVAGAVSRPLSGFVSDRIFGGRRKSIFMFFAIVAATMCLILGIFGLRLVWLIYPVVFFLGVGAIGFGGVYLTLLSELGGRGGAGKAAGLGSTVAVFGSILGPPSFGHIVDISGSYQLAWLSLALMGTLCAVLLIFVREDRRKI